MSALLREQLRIAPGDPTAQPRWGGRLREGVSRGVRRCLWPRDGGNRPPALTTPPKRIGARSPFTASIQEPVSAQRKRTRSFSRRPQCIDANLGWDGCGDVLSRGRSLGTQGTGNRPTCSDNSAKTDWCRPAVPPQCPPGKGKRASGLVRFPEGNMLLFVWGGRLLRKKVPVGCDATVPHGPAAAAHLL